MNQSVRKIIICFLCIALLLSVSACQTEGPGKITVTASRTANPTQKDLRGQITISAYRSSKIDNSLSDFMERVAMDFEGLEVVYDDDYTEEEYFASLEERVTNGTIGDVYLVRDADIASYAEKNYILDLTDYAAELHDYAKSGYTPVVIGEKLFPAAYAAAQYKGRLYMIPSEYDHKFVFLNYTMLEKAGIDTIPGDRWTWDEFKSYASAVTAIGGRVVMDYTDYAVWGAFVNGAGGSVFPVKEDGSPDTGRLSLSGEASLAGLNELVSFVKANNVATELGSLDPSNVGIAVIDRAEMGLWQNTPEGQYFDWSKLDFDWDFMHFPRFGVHSVGAHTIGFAVKNKADASEEHRELCANVALYTLFNEACKAYIGNGEVVPANMAVSDMKFWREYPKKGKNTSVFTSYSGVDFPAVLTSMMNTAAASKLNVGDLLRQAVNGGDLAGPLRAAEAAANAVLGG